MVASTYATPAQSAAVRIRRAELFDDELVLCLGTRRPPLLDRLRAGLDIASTAAVRQLGGTLRALAIDGWQVATIRTNETDELCLVARRG